MRVCGFSVAPGLTNPRLLKSRFLSGSIYSVAPGSADSEEAGGLLKFWEEPAPLTPGTNTVKLPFLTARLSGSASGPLSWGARAGQGGAANPSQLCKHGRGPLAHGSSSLLGHSRKLSTEERGGAEPKRRRRWVPGRKPRPRTGISTPPLCHQSFPSAAGAPFLVGCWGYLAGKSQIFKEGNQLSSRLFRALHGAAGLPSLPPHLPSHPPRPPEFPRPREAPALMPQRQGPRPTRASHQRPP